MFRFQAAVAVQEDRS